MRRAKRWLLIFAALLGLMSHGGALRPSFSKSTTTSTTTTTTSTEATSETTAVPEEETTSKLHTNATSKPTKKLTGIPQIDYIWDPNLPRELRGYNLSNYPFFSAVPPPEDIAFQCDGLHDGFYASIEYKCQVYHHCIYGIRHDFLCANFTAFDQRTFICHFVSEVDCKNSEKFWNRNDNLYMATTPKTTTTTTTEPPPTPEYRPRPRRPLRRRRPSDYYYDDDYYEDDYEDDRRANRRRKHRPRGRRPSEYDEDYEERRSYSDEEPRLDKRPKNRDRFRNDEEEDYVDDRRLRPRNRPKTSAMGRQGDLSERRKPPNGRKSLADRQSSLDERRSLSEDKPRNKLDEPADVVERRPLLGRRRHNGERRPAPVDDDLDKPNRRNEAEEEEKSLEPSAEKAEQELVRPTASSSKSSIYDRPRVPPRIPRPVPITEKKKYEYPAQKLTTSTANPLSDEYYDDYEYDDVAPAKDNFPPADPIDSKDPPRRRLQDDLNSRRAEDFPLRRTHSQTRRGNDDFPRKPGRPFQRKPLEQTKPVDDYELSKEKEDLDERPLPRKRPNISRDKDIEETEEDLPDHRPRLRETLRRPLKKVEPIDEDRERRRDNRRRPLDSDRSQAQVPSPLAEPSKETDEVYDEKLDDSLESDRSSAISESEKPNQRDGRPVIRVVKRPFLPSRGGSPHLPRGLQPVGAAHRKASTESTPIDMGSTISGVRLLEHGAPILRDHSENKGPRTTLPPQIEHPKSSLDELYENDYDVTLNDALNPTIKPLSSSNRNSLSPFNKYERAGYSAPSSSSYSSYDDSHFSSTDVRRRTITPPRNTRQEFRGASRIAQHFYDDFDY